MPKCIKYQKPAKTLKDLSLLNFQQVHHCFVANVKAGSMCTGEDVVVLLIIFCGMAL